MCNIPCHSLHHDPPHSPVCPTPHPPLPRPCAPTQISVSDVLRMEPVEGIRSIPRERWDLLCTVCRQRMGAKIQCEACFTAYHPLCARAAGTMRCG